MYAADVMQRREYFSLLLQILLGKDFAYIVHFYARWWDGHVPVSSNSSNIINSILEIY